jgi:REP element-mobilizing transposase RayT
MGGLIMRVARLKESGKRACYHVMSRVVDRQMVLGAEEKERFRKLMRAVEAFSGVNVLTYAILDNHFHILVEVPEPEPVSDGELIRRLGFLYDADQISRIADWIKGYREAGEDAAAELVKARYTRRMHDLSEFVKTLKQKYTQWHNKRRGRKGTLWEERFKSMMIQPDRAREGQWDNALLTMAAYIDLNAVRAGIVADPKDYRYSGYGEACGGSREARDGIAGIFANYGHGKTNWQSVGGQYRQQLFERGEKTTSRAGFLREAVSAVLEGDGKLTLSQALRCRVRYFSDGVVLGSKTFVEDVFQRNRDQFGLKRKSGARPLRRAEAGELCTMRDLRLEVISPSKAA